MGRPRGKGDREPNGRLRRKPKWLDGREHILRKRCQRAMLPISQEGMKKVEHVRFDTEAGWALYYAGVKNERKARDLWDTICVAASSWSALGVALEAPYPHPRGSSIAVAPEPFETRGEDIHLDLRSDEERASDAKRRAERIDSILSKLPLNVQNSFKRCVRYNEKPSSPRHVLIAAEALRDELG